MTEDERILWAREHFGETKVTVENVLDDLIGLDERTSTEQYGYFQGADGSVYADVWNETYHGVKKRYRVIVRLEEDTSWVP